MRTVNHKTHEYLRKLSSEGDSVTIPSTVLLELLATAGRLEAVSAERDHWKEELFAARDRVLGGDDEGGPYRS